MDKIKRFFCKHSTDLLFPLIIAALLFGIFYEGYRQSEENTYLVFKGTR